MKTLLTTRVTSLLLALASVPLFAEDIPLTNWTVPPYHRSSSSGGMTTMADVTPGIGFVAVAPCRLVDTRTTTIPNFPAGYGPPSLSQGSPRNFDLNTDPKCPGIPDGVGAYSLNVTVTNTQGPGFILIYPQGGAQPDVSTVNYVAGQTVANAAIVPAGTNGGVTVIAGVSGSELIIDINGYFTASYNSGVQFLAIASVNGGAAILGSNFSSTNGSHGVGGFAGGAGVVHGVQGAASPFTLAGSSGVHGIHDSAARGYGVFGETASTASGAAGVRGRDGTGPISTLAAPAGVLGESKQGFGVLGFSESRAVSGFVVDFAGSPLASGHLGISIPGTGIFGVHSIGNAFVMGNLSVTGTISAAMKPFVQPHPYDPSKQIRYVALEGPHSEVYFRGTAQISQGVTWISIPEDFRLVATPGSYSTLVTPVGGMATVAVVSEGEDGIVVQASRNVKIHYVVYAERDAMRNPEPIIENVDFRPDRDSEMVGRLPASYRQLMIQNGTLNADGTVNMETARRLGWDKNWRSNPGRPSPDSD